MLPTVQSPYRYTQVSGDLPAVHQTFAAIRSRLADGFDFTLAGSQFLFPWLSRLVSSLAAAFRGAAGPISIRTPFLTADSDTEPISQRPQYQALKIPIEILVTTP